MTTSSITWNYGFQRYRKAYGCPSRNVRRRVSLVLLGVCIVVMALTCQIRDLLSYSDRTIYQSRNNDSIVSLENPGATSIDSVLSVLRNGEQRQTILQRDNKANEQSRENTPEQMNNTPGKNVTKSRVKHLEYYAESVRNSFPLSVLPDPYAINNRNICRSVKELDLLILVISSASNIERRNTIRRSWGNALFYRNHTLKTVFLLGMSQNDTVNKHILNENNAFKDIVQGTFNDSYQNLTHKAVLGMRWTTENCPNAKLVVKVDDDTFVNMFQLLEDFDLYTRKSKEIICYKRGIGASLIQRTKGQWRLGQEYFQNHTYFPFPHCNGFFVIFTPDLIKPLYETSKITPFLWMDDVYLTGLVPEVIGGVQITHLANVLYHSYFEPQGVECFTSRKLRCAYIAVVTFTPDLPENLWNLAKENHKLPVA